MLTFMVASGGTASAHGVHDNSTLLESGMLHAVVTAPIVALLLALGAAAGLAFSSAPRANVANGPANASAAAARPRGCGHGRGGWQGGTFSMLAAAAFGGVGALMLPTDMALAGYGIWPLLGLAVAAVALMFLTRVRGPLLLVLALAAGALATMLGFLDGPSGKDWMWFLGGVYVGGFILTVLVALPIVWLQPRWLTIAARIVGAWCLTLGILQATLYLAPSEEAVLSGFDEPRVDPGTDDGAIDPSQ